MWIVAAIRVYQCCAYMPDHIYLICRVHVIWDSPVGGIEAHCPHLSRQCVASSTALFQLINRPHFKGLIYVTLVSVSAVVTVFLWLFVPARHAILQSVLANFSQTIGSVICSRMLLHLREYAQEASDGVINEDGNRSVALGKVSLATIGFAPRQTAPAEHWGAGQMITEVSSVDEKIERKGKGVAGRFLSSVSDGSRTMHDFTVSSGPSSSSATECGV